MSSVPNVKGRWWITAALLTGLVLAPTWAVGETRTVRAKGDQWSPEVRKIVKNDRVKWTNPTKKRHDVTSIGRKWKFRVILDPGEQTKKRFRKVGRYRYRCTLHSGMVDGQCKGMCGVVVVKKP